MTSKKKLKKPDRDNHGPLLLVALDSSRRAWKLCAERQGIPVMQWCIEQLDACAMATMLSGTKAEP